MLKFSSKSEFAFKPSTMFDLIFFHLFQVFLQYLERSNTTALRCPKIQRKKNTLDSLNLITIKVLKDILGYLMLRIFWGSFGTYFVKSKKFQKRLYFFWNIFLKYDFNLGLSCPALYQIFVHSDISKPFLLWYF